ncbi:hypothetical protein KMT30_48360, partial [Streptomyces sp. IBSBF 2953]|nr:hypothetical protein [Streptomyces hayashii]
MKNEAQRDAVFRAMTARGIRPVKGEDWDRDKVLGILRENHARHAASPYTREVTRIAAAVADEITDSADMPPDDIATVLLVAGGSLATLALLRPITAKTAA